MVVICEPYRDFNNKNVVEDTSGNMAMWACGSLIRNNFIFRSFFRAKVNSDHIYSYYVPPSATIAPYQEKLENVLLDTGNNSFKIIADDFNELALE